MKGKFLITFICLYLCSCSSLNKTLIYSSITGAIVGGITGRYLSPDEESKGFNTGLGAVTGAAISAGVGYLLFRDDPDNRELKTMLDPVDNSTRSVNLENIGLPIDQKFYKIEPDTSKVPEHLKNKIKKQIIIEKKIPSRIEQGNEGNSVFYPEQTILEYKYE